MAQTRTLDDIAKGALEGRKKAKADTENMSSARFLRNPLGVDIVIYIILVFLVAITVLPIVNVVAYSFSSPNAIAKTPFMVWPHEFTFEAYTYLFRTKVLLKAFFVSVGVTVIGTALSLGVTIPAAYGLSKVQTPGNKYMMGMVVLAMLFGAGVIPLYIVLTKLKLINTYYVLVLPYIASPFNIILMRNFFWSIPGDMEDSARIDGASDPRILVNIILPLSKAVIATIGLFYAVGHWNDFWRGLYFINDTSKWPLPNFLRSVVVDNQMTGMGATGDVQRRFVSPENTKAATIVFATVPILLVYPFVQKYFVQGIMIGAIKG